MPIDPAMLAKSIGTLTDLQPEQDLAATLHQAVIAAKQLFDADAAGVMLVDIDGRLRWASASDRACPGPGGQPGGVRRRPLRAGLRHGQAGGHARRHHGAALGRDRPDLCRGPDPFGVERPGRAGRRPDRDPGCVCGRPPGLGPERGQPPCRPMPGWWAACSAAAAKAELTGALADQLQTALDSRGLIERAKGALMERERLDEQEAFTHLRRAARSSGRKLVRGGPRGRRRPALATRTGPARLVVGTAPAPLAPSL